MKIFRNKFLSFVIVCLLIFGGFLGIINLTSEEASANNWDIETVYNMPPSSTSIALDSKGYPHIAFGYGYYLGSATSIYEVMYAKRTNNSWSIKSLAYNYYEAIGLSTQLAIDSNDNPHIIYDGTNNKLKYANKISDKWNFSTVFDDGNGHSSIILDKDNYPHISFRCVNGYLRYAKWTGSNWSIEIVDKSWLTGRYTSIDLDSNSYPHISYFDEGNESLKYARWTGTNWNIETVDNGCEMWCLTSLDIDSNDYAHISYYSSTMVDLKYARWTGTNWNIDTVDDTDDVGAHNSIALDNNNYPHICYGDDENDYLKYAKWTGSNWSIETVDTINYAGSDSSIILDNNNLAHISYEGDSGLKYAKLIGNKPPIAKLSFIKNVVNLEETLTFDGAESFDYDGNVIEYFFDFGDGINSGWATTSMVEHSYSNVGIYTISLKVKDNDGSVSEEVIKEITVQESQGTEKDSDGDGLSDEEEEVLAIRFKPVLYFDSKEKCFPTNIQYALDHSNLVTEDGFEKLSKKINYEDFLGHTGLMYNSYYLDNPEGDIRLGTTGITNEITKLEDEYVESDKNNYPYTSYVHVTKDTYDGNNYIVIQYWFYYAVNNGINNHEGDWEMVQVVLDDTDSSTPKFLGYSQHYHGQKANWDSKHVSKEEFDADGDGKTEEHPVVYIARGSHASYFKSRTFILSLDKVDGKKKIDIINENLIVMDESGGWLDFQGRWGQSNSKSGWNGPEGPRYRNADVRWNIGDKKNMWDYPIEWMDKCLATYPCWEVVNECPTNIMITNQNGKQTGFDGINVINNIPGAVVKTYGEVESYYLPKGLEYTIEINSYSNGIFNLTIDKPIETGSEVIQYRNISISVNTKAKLILGNHTEDYTMNLDQDGDGIFEKEILPTLFEKTESPEGQDQKEMGIPIWFWSILAIIIVITFIGLIWIVKQKKKTNMKKSKEKEDSKIKKKIKTKKLKDQDKIKKHKESEDINNVGKKMEIGYTNCPKCSEAVSVPFNAQAYPYIVQCPNCNAKGRLRRKPKNIRHEKGFEEEETEWR